MTSHERRLRLRRVMPTLVFVLIACVLWPRAGWADEAAARNHFRHGVELYDKKKYAQALEAFRAAYAEKPSAIIQQNIALSLKGLGRAVEAAAAFDSVIEEGGDTLKPATRAAVERELEQLAKVVATVRIAVVAEADKRSVTNAVVTVDDVALPPSALRKPVRLEPGIHVFTAHAEGFGDPPKKKLSLLAGSPVDATFELGPPYGTLTIRPSVADAVVVLDGEVVGRGTWSGTVREGAHKVVVSAPDHQTMTADIVVPTGTFVDYPITLLRPAPMPEGYVVPKPPPPEPAQKKRYIVPMVAYEAQSFRIAPALGERSGAKRQFTGGSVAVRGGLRLTRVVAVDLFGEIGELKSSYRIGTARDETKTSIVHWQLTPLLRISTTGSVRFMAASGVGLHGFIVSSDVNTVVAPPPGSTAAPTPVSATRAGSGVAWSWLTDLGMQIDVGPLFIEGATFIDVSGVGTTREEQSNSRIFLSSPSTRVGGRFGIGIPF